MSETSWVPLEANPGVVTRYLERAGVVGVEAEDVLALEPEALAWLRGPALALVLLFPCSPAYELHKQQQQQELEKQPPQLPPSLFHLRQTVHNACGTVALVHCVANWTSSQPLQPGYLADYLERARSLDPQQRGHLLETDPAVLQAHRELANQGQSAAPAAELPSFHHFVALVPHAGRLFELDGRKISPIDHGPTSPDSFLEDAAAICKTFMARDPDNVDFSVIALTEGSEN